MSAAFSSSTVRSFTSHRFLPRYAALCGAPLHCVHRTPFRKLCRVRMPQSTNRASMLATGTCAGQEVILSTTLSVLPVPILSDNYSYLLFDRASKKAAAVDPAEPQKLVREARARGYEITSVLTTHHHWDHAGGNEEIRRLLGADLEIIGSAGEDIPAANVSMKDGDVHNLKGLSLSVRAISTPCHTRGHVCYAVANPCETGPSTALFSGDTLFFGGCGRFFEGGAKDMLTSLIKLQDLAPDTLVFCGHEYTVSNLRFAAHVESENQNIREMLSWAEAQIARGDFTVPSTIGGELQYNPFMRCRTLLQDHRDKWSSEEEVMASLREMKNQF